MFRHPLHSRLFPAVLAAVVAIFGVVIGGWDPAASFSSCMEARPGTCVPSANANNLLNPYAVPCAAYDIYGRCLSGVPVPNPVTTYPAPSCAAYDVYGNCLYYPPPYNPAPPTCASFDQYGNCFVYQPAPAGNYVNPYTVPTYCIAFDQYGNCVATQYGSTPSDQGTLWGNAP
jgi:hypothetical protein